jgi:hypothetical protein
VHCLDPTFSAAPDLRKYFPFGLLQQRYLSSRTENNRVECGVQD